MLWNVMHQSLKNVMIDKALILDIYFKCRKCNFGAYTIHLKSFNFVMNVVELIDRTIYLLLYCYRSSSYEFYAFYLTILFVL